MDARRWRRAGSAPRRRSPRRRALWSWPAAACALLGVLGQGLAGAPAHQAAPTRPLGAAAVPTAIGTSAQPTVAIEGPGNSLWLYWENASAQWTGPLGVGAPGSTFATPAIAVGPSGLPTVAVQGPGNSLWLYWENQNAQWVGPLGLGAPGSTFAAPAISVGPSGLPTVAVQGPNNSLWLYWETPAATWVGPLGVGAGGSTFSQPAIASSPTNGLPTVAVQAPGGSLWLYWETPGATWVGPLGVGAPGSSMSAPAIGDGPSGLPTVAVEGPGNSMWLYWETPSATWVGPLGEGGPGSTFSQPSIAVSPVTGLPTIAVQAPGNGLWLYWETQSATWVGPLGVGGPGSTNGPPSIVDSPSGLPTVQVPGPGNAPWLYWETQSATWVGPLGLAGQAPVGVPSGTPFFKFTANLNESGSGSGYSAYINAHDASNPGNALSVGIQTDSTDPHSQGQPWFVWELVQNGVFSYDYLGPAPTGFNTVSLAWWPASQTAVFYEGTTPVADIHANFSGRLFFNVEGNARQNGDSVDDTVTNAQITVGDNCPAYCGLNGSWNTSSFNFYGLAVHDTNGAPQNGANFTVTGTVSGLPSGGNWDSHEVAGIAMIAQYWNGA